MKATEEVAGLRPLLDGNEVARIMNVSAIAVKRWADSGKIPYVPTPGGKYRYRYETIEALMKERFADVTARPKHRAGRKVKARAEASRERQQRTRAILAEAGQPS